MLHADAAAAYHETFTQNSVHAVGLVKPVACEVIRGNQKVPLPIQEENFN